MSKRIVTLIAGFTTLAILTGCAAKPYRDECYGNNCRHGYERSSDHYSISMNWQIPAEGERAAA